MKTHPHAPRPYAFARISCFALVSWLALPNTQAATYDWSGATNGNLSGTTANWSPNTVPTGTDIARWNAASYTNAPTANANQTIGELLFDAGNTNGVTFGSGALTLTLNGISGTGILVNNGSGAVNTGSARFALGAAQSWTNNSSNTLTVGGTIANGGFLLTLDGSGASALGGVISGAGGVGISNGTVTLSGTNTYTGGTALNSGTLNINNTRAVGGATSTFTINGGTLDNTSGSSITLASTYPLSLNGDFGFTGTNALNLGTGATTLGTAAGTSRTITANASTLTLGGVITNGSTANSLVKAGSGTLILTAANTFTGGVTLSAGTITLNSGTTVTSGAIVSGPLGTGTLTLAGGTLQDNGTNRTLANNISITGSTTFSSTGSTGITLDGTTVTVPSTVTINAANPTLTVNNTLTIANVIQNGTGTTGITKAGAGTLILTGNNTFSGGLNILSGQVNLGSVTVTPTGFFNGTITLGDSSGSNNATLLNNIAAGASISLSNAITVAAGSSGTLSILGSNNNLTLSGAVALNNNLTVSSSNSSRVVTFSNLVTQGGSAPLTITMSNGSGANSSAAFSGGVAIASGGLTFNNNAGGGTLTIGTGNITGTGALTLNANGVSAITVSAASINNAGNITNSGTGSGTTTISGAIGSNVTGLVQNSATSNLILANANSAFTGDTTVTSGNLNLRNTNSLQSSVLNMNGGSVSFGTSTTSGLTAVALGGLSGSGNVNLNNFLTVPTAVNLTLGNSNGQNASYGGALSNTNGSAGLTKIGTNTQTLSGINTYSGATNVSAGTLLVSSSGSINSSSAVTVSTGARFVYNSSTALTVATTLGGNGTSNRAILGGSGTIGGALTLDNLGDTLSPGNSPGILTFTNAQTWNSFSYDWEVNNFTSTTAGTAFDQIAISNSLSLTGGSGSYVLNLLSLTGGNVSGDVANFSETNRSWTILTTTAGITGFNAANWTLNTAGFTNNELGAWAISQVGNDIVLNYSAVPEPSTVILLMGGLGMLVLLRRKQTPGTKSGVGRDSRS